MVNYCVEMWQNLFRCRSWPSLKHNSDRDWTIVVIIILSTSKVAFSITLLGVFYYSALWSTKSRVFNRNSNKCCSSFWGQMYKMLPFVKTLFNRKKKTHLDKCTEKKNPNSVQVRNKKSLDHLVQQPASMWEWKKKQAAKLQTSNSASAQLPLEPEPVKIAFGQWSIFFLSRKPQIPHESSIKWYKDMFIFNDYLYCSK